MKLLSIIIPAYNMEAFLPQCVESILRTTSLGALDVVIVNDGSKDKTLEILENIANKDKSVKIISFSRNFGHQCAVTAGLKYVSGDAIVIIDSDLQDPPELISEHPVIVPPFILKVPPPII